MRRLMPGATSLVPLSLAALFVLAARPAAAVGPPCRPCAGVEVTSPSAAASALAALPKLGKEARLYVSWEVDLAGAANGGDLVASTAQAVQAVSAAGATPWLALVYHAPAPLSDHLAELGAELEATSRLARAVAPATHFQLLWRPPGGAVPPLSSGDYAFLIKRAGVAVTGAVAQARVITAPLPADPDALTALYSFDVAAYLDGVALVPDSGDWLTAAVERLAQLDPGSPVVSDAVPFPAEPRESLAAAAEQAAAGISLSFFRLDAPAPEALSPLVLLANQFQGDLSFDPYSTPTGGAGAWTFVRGKDLGLRVVARAPAGSDELVLSFSDNQLRRPARLDFETGEAVPLAGVHASAAGLEVRVADPGAVAVLSLERASAAELKGVAEQVTVASERQMPVEEILRRLQAFEDAQNRKLDTYSATNTTHLRFQVGGGIQTIDATLEGDFFFRRDAGFDWAWQSFFLNGVRWKHGAIPEIPLVQPEKAAALPLEILFTREYRYNLRGSENVDGRDCWVVDFAPAEGVATQKLFRGTVWVDRQIYARVRTRAVQLGLEGEVISNEETTDFSPIDFHGQPAAWSAESYFLPLRLVGQQILSVVNTTTVVNREVVLSHVEINAADFDQHRAEVLASDSTMVRDTPQGLRYLVKDEATGERKVKDSYDRTKVFALAGVFYDESLDYPLPLAGVNYFSLDFKHTGQQLNVFFAGALLTADLSQPRLFGSRFDLGGNVFALAVPLSDKLFRDNREVASEEVKVRPARVGLTIGHPVGSFFKWDLEYNLVSQHYQRVRQTADDFVLPSDHFVQSLGLSGKLARSNWSLSLDGSYNRRSKWEFWGVPGASEFDPDAKDFLRWGGTLAKSWYLPRFQRVGAELDYFGGSDLDRFSKYEFGFFGATRVHGYQSNRVRAEEGWASHLSYGFEVGEVFRLEAVADGALATDKLEGLDQELLGGVGLVGQFLGPWRTIVSVDVGTPVAGPDSGIVAYVVFLKLFD